MTINWKKDENNQSFTAIGEDGIMMLGWIQDENGKWFYTYPEDTIKDGINYSKGIMATGWIQEGDFWYYLYPEDIVKSGINYSKGSMATGWTQEGNFWYYLYTERTTNYGITYPKGAMATGWVQDIDWYYLYTERTTNYGITYPKGAMAVDWVKLGDKNKWYYLNVIPRDYNGITHYKGSCVCGTSLNINGVTYVFDSNGVWQPSGLTGDSLVSIDLVKYVGEWEGMYSKAYEDPYYPGVKAYWTIGYGTCYCAIPEAFPDGLDSECTEEQALGWLNQEINKVAIHIKEALGDNYSNMSQQAFDCLCDIGYNAGTGALIGGNTWSAIISGDSDRITSTLMSWNKANGQYSQGLNNRCESRVNMCLNGVYNSDH